MRAVILLALIGAALAVPRNTQRIVGGSETTIDVYPYMSNMQYGLWGILWFQSCGGSLLTSTTVLTAAHCVIGDTPAMWRVVLGTSFASSGGSVHPASQLIVHAEYSGSTLENDIAIVRLETPATFSSNVGVARIAGPDYNIADNSVVTAVGWGTLWSNGPAPEQLQHVDINIINQEYCAAQYAYLKTLPGFSGWPDITDVMICAGIQGVGGKDACQGDSGGPLAHEGDVLVGITSWGYGCAEADYPGVSARVSSFTDWIVANAA